MTASLWYRLAADVVLLLHFLIAAYITLGLLATYIGWLCSWAWVRNYYFRLLHIAAILVVAAQSWAGVWCPLTVLESALRQRASQSPYPGSFIAYWLERLLYYQAPEWVFIALYTAVAGLTALAWWLLPPKRP